MHTRRGYLKKKETLDELTNIGGDTQAHWHHAKEEARKR